VLAVAKAFQNGFNREPRILERLAAGQQRPELVLRRSIPSLRTPLSTLRLQPHDRTRMTRGRCSSLRLHRDGLAPSTFRRSPGAPVHSIRRRH
jgi:hypothetical protein